ncbi:hypothetical protein [Chryseobacterium indoltheticum]
MYRYCDFWNWSGTSSGVALELAGTPDDDVWQAISYWQLQLLIHFS